MTNEGTRLDWTSFKQPTFRERVAASGFKSNSEAIANLAAASKDPLAFSNDIQRIYYAQVNPAALKKPYQTIFKDVSGMALRYGTAAGAWGLAFVVSAYYILPGSDGFINDLRWVGQQIRGQIYGEEK
eukprot:CAMPEP_0117037106 /NCGR_PEP_ID=MMETSP0472-20121206/26234_1 /TAXON_ID=693140 ORGANISM="Tiarina fusus, Strain LIS" /NCGR_SAMPLE_ID=MMETSP0472 /ASSEMBLY_ACC=CAM_ASM_000603 /LENGTH=127 /DNA_ID=CAMNT_0004747039 /DNA_START=17 /DNA_END=400 /DNA_ORIENTATION=-